MRMVMLLGALAVVILMGGVAFLAVSDPQPQARTVRVELPDSSLPR